MGPTQSFDQNYIGPTERRNTHQHGTHQRPHCSVEKWRLNYRRQSHIHKQWNSTMRWKKTTRTRKWRWNHRPYTVIQKKGTMITAQRGNKKSIALQTCESWNNSNISLKVTMTKISTRRQGHRPVLWEIATTLKLHETSTKAHLVRILRRPPKRITTKLLWTINQMWLLGLRGISTVSVCMWLSSIGQ